MGTTLDDTSLLQDHDTVTVAYCGKSVGDHEGCPAFHQLIHTILYQFFGTGINGTGGFVQDQDRRICNSCTGDGEKLSLALAQVCTVSTEKGVITLWKPADKTVSVGKFCCGDDLFICGIQFSVADVFHNGCREQVGILKNDAHGTAKIVFFDLGDIDAVVTDLTFLNVVKTVQKVGDGGFPAPVDPTKAIFWPGCAYMLMS